MNVLQTARAIAVARIVAGVVFFSSGFAKVTGTFVTEGFARSAGSMAKTGFPIWRPFLERIVVVHPAPFARAVALGELALGVSLILGFGVRWSSVAGIALMVVIGLGGAWPAPGAAWHRYVTSWLATGAYAMLFLIFAVSNAGEHWGLDGRRK
jgi:uncharacterized membrane protein YphA (DoxX/SURF4 family)